MKDTEAKAIMEQLFGLYPNAPAPSRRTREAWTPELADVDVIDARQAVLELGRSQRFLPSLAEVLEMCAKTRYDRLHQAPAQQTTPARPFADYGYNAGVRAPCDDELEGDRWSEAVRRRGSMVGK